MKQDKIFLRTGHAKDMFFACKKIKGKPTKVSTKKDGYSIGKVFYDMGKAVKYIKKSNSV